MNGWKVISILLFLCLIGLGFMSISNKMEHKKDVSTYIESVNGWNKKQDELQKEYKEYVLDETDAKIALQKLSSIVDENESLIRRTQQFKTDYPELREALVTYQQALHHISDAYQDFYYGMDTNEETIVKDGKASLDKADDYFQIHEEQITALAKKNFIHLEE
ncbi:hypothetical protein CN918_26420 [Priestia megaterium]|nr:hypothetical protein CN918_26420 [Priestia megaterium]